MLSEFSKFKHWFLKINSCNSNSKWIPTCEIHKCARWSCDLTNKMDFYSQYNLNGASDPICQGDFHAGWVFQFLWHINHLKKVFCWKCSIWTWWLGISFIKKYNSLLEIKPRPRETTNNFVQLIKSFKFLKSLKFKYVELSHTFGGSVVWCSLWIIIHRCLINVFLYNPAVSLLSIYLRNMKHSKLNTIYAFFCFCSTIY